ncbi:MAG: class I SAM-dependent methyltransferase [bacterium]|nr:class I SAM-dependent methyltransferase [bacterium]
MHPALKKQIDYNAKTLSLSDSYAEHRARVTERLLWAARELAGGADSLTILGCGNCNDLEPLVLQRQFRHIHLIDIDSHALSRARQRLESIGLPDVQCQEFELTGIFARAGCDRAADPRANSGVGDLIAASRMHASSIELLRSNCVVSSCVLSQLIDAVLSLVPQDAPDLADLIIELRRKHLATMLDCLHPGGAGLLVSDFVSSETLPELHTLPESELPRRLALAIEQGNFFTGCNPFAIFQQLLQLQTAGVVEQAGWSKPWLWNIADKRMAVNAFWFRKAARTPLISP